MSLRRWRLQRKTDLGESQGRKPQELTGGREEQVGSGEGWGALGNDLHIPRLRRLPARPLAPEA